MTLRVALDTSTRLGSVALGEDGRLLAEVHRSVRAAHAESALPSVDALLEAAGRRPAELDGVVVGAGPGSFTGVRIAAALAKGLCFGLDVPLFAYDSLAAVAAGLSLASPVCVLFDARRDEVYAAAYTEPPEPEFGPAALDLPRLLDRLGDASRWRFAGDGATLHRVRLEAAGGRVLPPHLGHPRAAGLLWLAERHPDAGRIPSPSEWEPRYVRRSGADREAQRARSGEDRDRAAAGTPIRGPG